MTVDLRRAVGCNDNAMLLGQRSDAQRLGKAGRAGRVELHTTYAAFDDEIAHRKAGQFALAMRQRDRRCRRQPREISGLQVPVQRFLEPEDAVRLDAMGELNAINQIIGRVHVEHQLRRRADRRAHRTDPLDIGRDAAEPGLQLDRAVAVIDKLRHLLGIGRIRRPRPVIAAGRVGEERPVGAAEQPPHRHTTSLALQIPQRDVDAGDRRHDSGTLGARHRWWQPVLAVDDARLKKVGARRGQREQLVPHSLMRQRVHTPDDLAEPRDPLADARHRRAVDLAIADEPVIGRDFGQDHRPRLRLLMRGPHRLGPRHRNRMSFDRANAGHRCDLRR